MRFQDRLASPRSTGIHGVKEGALYSFLPLIQCSGVHRIHLHRNLYLHCVIREYDTSRDTEEPQQTLSFATHPIKGQYTDEDPNAREAVSFCIGKGTADWSPLTIYALMRSGDVYAACPFLPTAA